MNYNDMELGYFGEEERERFESLVEKGECCWEWKGRRTRSKGYEYGIFCANGQVYKAHRVAYLLANGVVDSALTIDHLCRNKMCVRPEHMEQVSAGENARRQYADPSRLYSLVCRKGHAREFGVSVCRRCRVVAVAASQAKRPEYYRQMKARNKREERARKRCL